jgi:hypothetical protein
MGISKKREQEQAEKKALWQQHLNFWQTSKQSATAYCKEQNLSVHRFKYWQYRLMPESKQVYSGISRGSFLEVKIEDERVPDEQSIPERIEIISPGGYRIQLFGSSHLTLVQALQALRQLSC